MEAKVLDFSHYCLSLYVLFLLEPSAIITSSSRRFLKICFIREIFSPVTLIARSLLIVPFSLMYASILPLGRVFIATFSPLYRHFLSPLFIATLSSVFIVGFLSSDFYRLLSAFYHRFSVLLLF